MIPHDVCNERFLAGTTWLPRPRAMLLLAATVVGLGGCDSILGGDDTVLYEIGEATVPCMGPFPQECMLVRRGNDGEFGTFHGTIEGFSREPGYRYDVLVTEHPVRNPLPDGPGVIYRLKQVVSRTQSPHAPLLQRLDSAQAVWNAAKPDAYTVVVQRNCMCVADARGPARVEVAREHLYENPTGRFYVADGRRVPAEYDRLFPTIQELFGIIRHALVTGAADVDVTLDPARGFPTRVWIDRSAAAADDDVEYIVQSLQ